MPATPYTEGFAKGQAFRREVSLTGRPFIPEYLSAQSAVRDARHTPIMSDPLTRAHRRMRSFALGYLRGLRQPL